MSMYDMGRATRNGLGDSMTDEQRRKLLDEVAEQRWKEAETGEARIRFGTPEKLLGNANAVQKEFSITIATPCVAIIRAIKVYALPVRRH